MKVFREISPKITIDSVCVYVCVIYMTNENKIVLFIKACLDPLWFRSTLLLVLLYCCVGSLVCSNKNMSTQCFLYIAIELKKVSPKFSH